MVEKQESKKYFTCPMHEEVRQEKPGICPECGMALVPATDMSDSHHEHAENAKEYDKHAGHSPNMFAKKFWLSLVLTIPVVLYSGVIEKLLGFKAPAFAGSSYIPLVLGSVVFFYGGWIFIRSAYRELRAKMPGMMTLIALAIVTAYSYSIFVTFFGGENLFWELTTLITIMLLGHWMEMNAVKNAQGALKELSKLLPDKAEVIRGGENILVPLSELKEGDMIFIRPGGKIPADAKVIKGDSEVNEAMITGESKPVNKSVGDEIIAGTINSNGALFAEVTKIGEHTFLAGVMRLVAEAQASKSRLQVLSDRAAFYLTLIAIVSGVTTLAVWLFVKADPAFAFNRLVAVLVIACPHALGLAIPLVASISTTMAAKNGFLVRQRLALEQARQIDTVLFDKTGTLTKGEFGVRNIWPSKNGTEDEVLKMAASVDAHSEHFVSKAIVKEAKNRGLQLLEVDNFSRIPGVGVRGTINDSEVIVGGVGIFDVADLAVSPAIKEKIEDKSGTGETIVFVIRNKELVGTVSLADLIREDSRLAIKDLQNLGIRVGMITGDSEAVASWVAGELGIDEYFARVLPEEKAKKVKLLQSKGGKVAMVGDGINDAPALAQADLGIAIGAGTNVAIESAGIILVKNDPRDVAKIIKLSKLTYGKMIQNLFWATGYNIVALPLAAGVLVSKGILLQPALAAVFMSLSTVIVAVNALSLNKEKL
ncbi:MAG: heavy metal translocating P-type ATPase [Candidatus Paceibacterota bacterium]